MGWYPSHYPGDIVQIGLNLGAHNVHVLEWAKSFTKTLNYQTKAEYDCDALGVLSIFWSFVQSVMLTEVLDTVDACLEKENLSHLATCNMKLGKFRYLYHFLKTHPLYRWWLSY